jgi:hypothetical protein
MRSVIRNAFRCGGIHVVTVSLLHVQSTGTIQYRKKPLVFTSDHMHACTSSTRVIAVVEQLACAKKQVFT